MRLRGRRRLRAVALSILYQIDLLEDWDKVNEIVESTIKRENITDTEDKEFVRDIVRNTSSNKKKIDEIISNHLQNWDLERLNVLERNILRIGVYELLSGNVPYKVAISEAVELAKIFGADGATSLVNGVLDKVADKKGVKK